MIGVGLFLLGVLVGIVFMAICFTVASDPSLRGESLSERHDRLDAEARVAAYDATVVPKPRPRGSAS